MPEAYPTINIQPDTAQPWPFAESDAQNTVVSMPPIPATTTQPQPTLGVPAADAVQPLSDEEIEDTRRNHPTCWCSDRRWLATLAQATERAANWEETANRLETRNARQWENIETLTNQLAAARADTAELAVAAHAEHVCIPVIRSLKAEIGRLEADTAELGRQLREARDGLTVAVQDTERLKAELKAHQSDHQIAEAAVQARDTLAEQNDALERLVLALENEVDGLRAALQAAQAHRERLVEIVDDTAANDHLEWCVGMDGYENVPWRECRADRCVAMQELLAEQPAAAPAVVAQDAREAR